MWKNFEKNLQKYLRTFENHEILDELWVKNVGNFKLEEILSKISNIIVNKIVRNF